MATLQVRAMDDRLYEALGRRAVMDNRSISQEVVMIVKEYLSGSTVNHKRKTESFLELAGTWQDDRSAEEIICDIGKSRQNSVSRFKEKI